MSKQKKVLLAVVLLLVAGAATGWFIWNKPHRKVDGEDGIKVTAAALIAEYAANSDSANAKYLNKNLEVTGMILKTEKNQDGFITVLFASEDPMSSVFCTMREKDAVVDSGKEATIQGFCSGYTTDVILTGCIKK